MRQAFFGVALKAVYEDGINILVEIKIYTFQS